MNRFRKHSFNLFLAALICFTACTGLGEAMRASMDPGYNSWYIQTDTDQRMALSTIESHLTAYGFTISNQNTYTMLETEYRPGPNVTTGKYNSWLPSQGSIKLTVNYEEEDTGESYIKIESATQVENRYSSYSNSRKENPTYSQWDDDLVQITQLINYELGTSKNVEIDDLWIRAGGYK